jgi:hypothetical protein
VSEHDFTGNPEFARAHRELEHFIANAKAPEPKPEPEPGQEPEQEPTQPEVDPRKWRSDKRLALRLLTEAPEGTPFSLHISKFDIDEPEGQAAPASKDQQPEAAEPSEPPAPGPIAFERGVKPRLQPGRRRK